MKFNIIAILVIVFSGIAYLLIDEVFFSNPEIKLPKISSKSKSKASNDSKEEKANEINTLREENTLNNSSNKPKRSSFKQNLSSKEENKRAYLSSRRSVLKKSKTPYPAFNNLNYVHTSLPKTSFNLSSHNKKPVYGSKSQLNVKSTFKNLSQFEPIAGNTNDYYLNMDRGHAMLKLSLHPQLLKFPAQAKPDASTVIIGNASLGIKKSSMARYTKMANQMQASQAYEQYRRNVFHWFPAVRDVFIENPAMADQSIAMIPYASMSYGKSGTELDEMRKLAYTLAAFKPNVKDKLKKHGLLMPTYQMILRRTLVNSDTDYLSTLAHPSAFTNRDNDVEMMKLANSISPHSIPPLVQLKVLDENYQDKLQLPNEMVSERLFTTPCSIARIHRGYEYTKTLIVSAEDSYDCNQQALSFHYKVLRGNPRHIRIHKLNPTGSKVKIEIDYDDQITDTNTNRASALSIIGVFVNNGYYYSAPAFITSLTLANQKRSYLGNKLKRIVYQRGNIEPKISIYNKNILKDELIYNNYGLLKYVKRHMRNRSTPLFTSEGLPIQHMDQKQTDEFSVLYNQKSVQYHTHNMKILNEELTELKIDPPFKIIQYPQYGQLELDKTTNRVFYRHTNPKQRNDRCTLLSRDQKNIYRIYFNP